MTVINGIHAQQVAAYRDQVRHERGVADRRPTLVARWLGGARSEVAGDDATVHLGGDDELSAMESLLGSLAACEVHLLAMHAALMGIEIHELRVEATGTFNIARFVGVDDASRPGYEDVELTVHLRTGDATDAQLARLHELCDRSSPVGDTLRRIVRLTTIFDARTATGPTPLGGVAN